MPAGRPTKYRKEYAEQAYRLCLLGATNEFLAESFGVTLSTIGKWLSEKEEFSDAVKNGREVADAKVGEALFQRATGYEHPDTHISNYQGDITETPITKHYPPDPVSMIFWLKNRRPDLWRDKSQVDHGVTDELADTIAKARERAAKTD